MDQRALSYLNLFAIFGALPALCELDSGARRLITGKDISIGIAVQGGPSGSICFRNGICTVKEGTEGCTILLPFGSPERFNGMIDGTVTPIPVKGLLKVGFLLREFMELTKLLTTYLKPEPEAMKDPRFADVSTRILFRLIISAVCQLGNEDPVSRCSAGYITDGCVRVSVGGGPVAGIRVKDHRLTPVFAVPKAPTSYMDFADMATARALFDGAVNAVVCVGEGLVRVGGMISQVDNVNRILDRVSAYLA